MRDTSVSNDLYHESRNIHLVELALLASLMTDEYESVIQNQVCPLMTEYESVFQRQVRVTYLVMMSYWKKSHPKTSIVFLQTKVGIGALWIIDPLISSKSLRRAIRKSNHECLDPPRLRSYLERIIQSWPTYEHPTWNREEESQGSNYNSKEELEDLAQACDKLWKLDSTRLIPGKDNEIDCGEGKTSYQKQDRAQGSLFSWLSEDIFRRTTYSRFCSLLDNYNLKAGCKEVVTQQERQEQAAFVEEISRTAPIKYLYKYLVSKLIISDGYDKFKKIMSRLWLDLYDRGDTSGSSSACEHVFVGEIKQRGEQEVSGFHNWIQFYVKEAKGKVDYQGFIFPRRHVKIPDSETQLLTINFDWRGMKRSVTDYVTAC
ncbi:uncharacterized protein [Aristolochia californica]|uniref:uncharacterized protein n=1 Tax=Aristolochia californica TaxID=171875 RepID=UPI0035DE6BCB